MTKEEFRKRLMSISEASGDTEAIQEELLTLGTAFNDRFDEVERLREDLTRVEGERDEAQRRYRERFFTEPKNDVIINENIPEASRITIDDILKENLNG